ncbi:MAG TPA: pyridoxal phosphate-dependent aminotransferase [Blastocatellia bacterium]|nr:pyridoxal phosphate-dependent aminotransferase [Blastocatellia bacterium]
MAGDFPKTVPFVQSVYTSNIAVSSTLVALLEAERLRSQGIDVVDLGPGEPDFPTPEKIKQAAKQAIDENFTRYTSTSGIPQLKDAIITMMQRDFGAAYTRKEIIVTVGGKQAIFNAMASILNPGDEVLMAAPYWVTFPEIARFLQVWPRIIDTEQSDFLLKAEDVKNAITGKTRLLIVNSPNNPTGRVIEPAEFTKIVEVAAEHNILVISDECYLQFVYPPNKPFTAAQLPKELRDWVIVCGSFSKTYAMTGWRVGFALGRWEWIDSMLRIQSHSTSNATSISQKAAIEAATGPQDSIGVMLAEYAKRRDWLIPALNQIPGIQCSTPEGAFYAFPNVKGLLGKAISTSDQLAQVLLEEAHVVVTPGRAFGTEGYLRISYATSMETLKKGVERIAEVAKGLV